MGQRNNSRDGCYPFCVRRTVTGKTAENRLKTNIIGGIDMMSHCCICGTPLDTVIEIENKDIIGMAKNYTHRIGICPACELIVTMNPFSQASLSF